MCNHLRQEAHISSYPQFMISFDFSLNITQSLQNLCSMNTKAFCDQVRHE